MIDLHTHILPCMDDGSKSVEETSLMLRTAYEQGVKLVVATPHFYARQNNPRNFLEKRLRSFERIEYDSSSMPQILLGAEVSYFDGISNSEAILDFKIGNTNLILIEMPFQPWNSRIVDEICSIPTRFGLTPVLAHVERYCKFSSYDKYMEQLFYSGALFQYNADFFISRITRRRAMNILKYDGVHFIASDCHNMTSRAPNLGIAAEKIKNTFGVAPLTHINELASRYFNLNLSI